MNTTDSPKSPRGWSSVGLKTVGDNPSLWTVTDAARLLGPPELSPAQVRQLVKIFDIPAQGKRRVTADGRSGRHARVYEAQALILAYDAIQKQRHLCEDVE